MQHRLKLHRYAQGLIRLKQYETVRDLLDDDESLHQAVASELDGARNALKKLLEAVGLLLTMQARPMCKGDASWSEIYIRAMSSELIDSSILKDIFTSFKKFPSDVMESLLGPLAETIPTSRLVQIVKDLRGLISSSEESKPLRSQYDVHHETLRTTVVAQKVSLSKNSSALSSEDAAYTKIVDRAYTELQNYFQKTLIDPQDLFLNEILIYDMKSPHREVFTPRPRFAIERALSSPHDYLGCDCCDGVDNGLSSTQPATAILYQLYLESGSLINTADLWSAFWTIVGVEGAEDEESEQQRALALFSRGLAELKYLGMIKNSRKKTDHIAKLAWKGL
ncbi:origin recognition complex subunit 3, partial [Lecanoromycetidae sp. Uapishka_2]